MTPSIIGVSQFAVLTAPIRQGLDLLAQTGIPGLEVFMEGAQWWDPGALGHVEAAREQFAGPLSLHPPAWDINIASYTQPVRAMAVDVYGRALDWARRIGATYIVVHIGWRGDHRFPRIECLRRAEEALRMLAPRAAEGGVRMAVENVGWHGLEVCDQDEFTALIHRLPAGAGGLLDVGHAHLAQWDIARAVRDLAPRMIALHLHDNHGASDEHLPIGDGAIDWDSILPGLPAMPADCQQILEYAPATPLDRLRQGADLLSRVLRA